VRKASGLSDGSSMMGRAPSPLTLAPVRFYTILNANFYWFIVRFNNCLRII